MGSKHTRGLALVWVATAWMSSWAADEASIRQELSRGIKRHGSLSQQVFSLPFRCAELQVLISNHLAQASQRMLGFPVQLAISHFTYAGARAPGSATVTVHLADLPPEQKAAMEQQANALLRGSPLEQLLRGVACDAWREGIGFLEKHQAQCELKKSTDDVADFRLDGANQQILPGLQLQEAWFRLDRKSNTITGTQFRFTNGKTLGVRLRYQDAAPPGGGTVPFPLEAAISHDIADANQVGVAVPSKLTIQYGKPTFPPPAK